MKLHTLPQWEQDALTVARAHPEEYVEIAQWLKIAKQTSFIDEQPIAVMDLVYAVFGFETVNVCALALGHAGDVTLTHIFIKGSSGAISGRRNRAMAVAAATGISPMNIR